MSDIFDEVAKKRDIFDDVAEIGGSMPVSTITGKSIPTDAEKISASKQAVGEILPIAGDIAGAAIMPQLRLAQAAPMLARGGASVLNTLLRGAGSMAGSVTGEVERQLMTKNFDPNQVYIQGGAGLAGEVLPGLVGPGLKKAVNPALEVASDLTISGTKFKRWYADKLKDYSHKRVENFVKEIAPESVKSKINEVGLSQAVNEAFDANAAVYGHFKDGLEKVAKEHDGYVPLENTQSALQAWLKEELPKHKTQSQAETAIVKSMGFKPGGSDEHQHVLVRKLMRGDDLSEREVNYLLSNIYVRDTKKWQAMLPEMQGQREQLKELIVEDLNSLGAGAAKKTADEMHRELKNYQRIKNIYESSAPLNKETGERKFYPHLFAENVYRNERVIRETMPDVWPKIKSEADKMRSEASRIAAGERSIGGMPMLAGLASSAFTGYWPVGEGFGLASAWALMTPTGKAALNGVMKYGVQPALKTGLHVGGHLIDFEKSHK